MVIKLLAKGDWLSRKQAHKVWHKDAHTCVRTLSQQSLLFSNELGLLSGQKGSEESSNRTIQGCVLYHCYIPSRNQHGILAKLRCSSAFWPSPIACIWTSLSWSGTPLEWWKPKAQGKHGTDAIWCCMGNLDITWNLLRIFRVHKEFTLELTASSRMHILSPGLPRSQIATARAKK